MSNVAIWVMLAGVTVTPAVAQRGTQQSVPPALQAVRQNLLDPSSAQFRNVRQMPNGAVCGEINGKNRMGGYVGFQPFAADLAKGVVNLHTSQNHAANDSYSLEMRIYAVCDRTGSESVKDAQIRHMNAYLAKVESNSLAYCKDNPNNFQCAPSWEQMVQSDVRNGMMVYIH
jgi:hypothetical protein